MGIVFCIASGLSDLLMSSQYGERCSEVLKGVTGSFRKIFCRVLVTSYRVYDKAVVISSASRARSGTPGSLAVKST